MTTREFDAPTSSTRRASFRQDGSRRSVIRAAWLLGRFIRREPVRYQPHTARFGTPPHVFRCDIAAVRAARIYRGTELLGGRCAVKNNVVPFKPPETFERFGIDWTREAKNEGERSLREAFLTYETSCGSSGLVSLVLLALVSRRQGAVAADLAAAADFAEVMLAMQLRKHVDDALVGVKSFIESGGSVWER
jgi:hypothetical protein